MGYSAEIEGGRLDVDDVIRPTYEEAGEALGEEFKYPEKKTDDPCRRYRDSASAGS